MIAYIKGKVALSQPTCVIVDVGWGGIEVFIPLSTFEKLPKKGDDVELLTHFHVREDGFSIFGFISQQEKEMFKLLISISKIGPKVALGILSGIHINELKSALVSGDSRRISLVPGVGKKTAERLIVELKDKIPTEDFASEEIKGDSKQKEMVSDTVTALISLGYNNIKAQQAVRDVVKTHKLDSLSIEELIKLSLKVIK